MFGPTLNIRNLTYVLQDIHYEIINKHMIYYICIYIIYIWEIFLNSPRSRGTLHQRRGSLHGYGRFFPERSRHFSTFNRANDSSHRQLFESAIRLETYIYFAKVTRMFGQIPILTWSVWSVWVCDRNPCKLCKNNVFSRSDCRFEQLTIRAIVCTIKSERCRFRSVKNWPFKPKTVSPVEWDCTNKNVPYIYWYI